MGMDCPCVPSVFMFWIYPSLQVWPKEAGASLYPPSL